MHTQETKEPKTRINKSQDFALALVSWLTIQNALEEAKLLPEAMKAQVEEAICKSLLQCPTPAEA